MRSRLLRAAARDAGRAAAIARVEPKRPAVVQRMAAPLPAYDIAGVPIADAARRRALDRTGLPGTLKAGIEALSGMSMDAVRVHYRSPEPARIGAQAFTRGSDIHVAPGRERHLPHEAWHAVQQAQGKVVPTTRAADVPINDEERLEREADVMGARAMQAGATATISAPPSRPAPPPAAAGTPAVAQCVLDIGGKRATSASKAALVSALKTEASSGSLVWKPQYETLLDTELGSDKTRVYGDVVGLLADLITVEQGGSWAVAQQDLPRSQTQGRALRQAVKFHKTHAPNPSQPNPIAKGFHTYPSDSLLKPPSGVQILQEGGRYHYFRESGSSNTADFQIFTTGDPNKPGYIYVDQEQFAGNYDTRDTTGTWSEQGRDESQREYMDLGTHHKYPNHTVGHVLPFEHSPLVHDTATTSGGTTTYQNTDQFKYNVVIENPPVGEQIKRAQVEHPMMSSGGGFFYQYPVYPGTPVAIDTTYNSKPIVPGQLDTSGNPIVSKKRERPDELQFGRPDGSGGVEWAAFDNTGMTRYDTDSSKLKKKKVFDTRSDPNWWKKKKKKNEKRVKKGMDTALAWKRAKKLKPVTPPLAQVLTMADDIATYDARIEALKADVTGYMTPPGSPLYMGTPNPVLTKQVTGLVFRGQAVTTTDGIAGVVITRTAFDEATNESTVELEPTLDPFV
ncbi:eCIS core domain-containing protein [Sphingomonas sp. DT-204]|uniref:eCIS core domain-containing protein n=1 Tax=Sphingomonas sp. DT-204 TaxID=3396166 RepID=UPI003F1C4CA5